jgi:pyruvate dehydrogenase E2 component (dihydrolipoamide acetyltransferase)
MARYRVRVREDWRWDRAQVAGREFTKAGEVLAEGHVNEEMRQSPLLEIEEIAPDVPVEIAPDVPVEIAPDAPMASEDPAGSAAQTKSSVRASATQAARDLAEAHGVDLREVEGTGEDGRVLVADVERIIDAG